MTNLTATALHSKTAPVSFSDYLFTFDGRRPYYERKAREIWKAACGEVGIKIHQKNAVRHSLGCQLLDEGAELALVQEIYGHSTIEMTRRYAKRSSNKVLEALEKRGKVIKIREAKEN